jgi:hypothetical protein
VRRYLLIATLLATPAMAQDISDADKTAALKRGYILNGNSASRWGSIDLTAEPLPARNIPIDKPVKLDSPRPKPTAVASAAKPMPERNICTRHGKRKIITRGGKSWRCSK